MPQLHSCFPKLISRIYRTLYQKLEEFPLLIIYRNSLGDELKKLEVIPNEIKHIVSKSLSGIVVHYGEHLDWYYIFYQS